MNNYLVYRLRNETGELVWIGCTKNLRRRLKNHTYGGAMRDGSNVSPLKGIKFSAEIMQENLCKADALKLESFLIINGPTTLLNKSLYGNSKWKRTTQANEQTNEHFNMNIEDSSGHIFPTLESAAKWHKVTIGAISFCANGKTKHIWSKRFQCGRKVRVSFKWVLRG